VDGAPVAVDLAGGGRRLVLQSLTHHGPLRWVYLALAAAYAVLWPVARRQQQAAVARYRAALSRPPGPGA
jgi:hypothetical protein